MKRYTLSKAQSHCPVCQCFLGAGNTNPSDLIKCGCGYREKAGLRRATAYIGDAVCEYAQEAGLVSVVAGERDNEDGQIVFSASEAFQSGCMLHVLSTYMDVLSGYAGMSHIAWGEEMFIYQRNKSARFGNGLLLSGVDISSEDDLKIKVVKAVSGLTYAIEDAIRIAGQRTGVVLSDVTQIHIRDVVTAEEYNPDVCEFVRHPDTSGAEQDKRPPTLG